MKRFGFIATLLGMALVSATADAPIFTYEQSVKLMKNAYICGKADGMVQVFEALGYADKANRVREASSDAKCDDIREVAKP